MKSKHLHTRPAGIIILSIWLCLAMFSGTLTVRAQVQIAVTHTSCSGNTGSATVTGVENAYFPFIYKWSNGATSATINNLAPGTYTVTVTDAHHCKGVGTAVVRNEGSIDIVVSSGGTIPFCIQDGAPEITITASGSGGTPPYIFSPATSLTVSSSGSYTFTATDASNCTGQTRVAVSFVPVLCSRDPNDIVGPAGYGEQQYYSSRQALPYQINFENDPDFATAPAQRVLVSYPFDQLMNRSSFRLGSFSFANMTFSVPPNSTSYNARLNLADSIGVLVDVIAGIDVANNNAFWIFQAIDPATGLPPQDPLKGMLPVNDSTHAGEGYVTFTVKPKNTVVTGDSLKAQGIITFDVNPFIATNIWHNTADAAAPASQVNALEASYDTTVITISFTSQDDNGGSGVAAVELYVSEDGGPFEKYGETPADSSLSFSGKACSQYRFFSVARDHTGNTEALKTEAEASCVLSPAPVFSPVNTSITVLSGEDVTLQLSAQGAKTYQWESSSDGGLTYEQLFNNATYSGVNTPSLQISDIPLSLNGYVFRCMAGNGVCTSYSDSISVTIISALSGRVFYENSLSTPITNSWVELFSLSQAETDSAYTFLNGNYLFIDKNPGTYFVKPDIQKPWGGVNATDALLVLRHFASMITLGETKRKAADVNNTGTVNAADALLIARRFVNFISSFTAGDWYNGSDTVELGGPSVSRDFPVLCMGDVDGSYIPGTRTSPKIRIVEEGMIKIQNGEEYLLPFIAADDIAAGAISIVMEFPGELISIEEVMLKNPAFHDNLIFRTEGNILSIAWYSLQGIGIDAGDALFSLRIRIGDRPLLGRLGFNLMPGSEVSDSRGVPYDNVRLNLPRLFSDHSTESFALGQNYPNPFARHTEIAYYLSEDADVILKVYNPLGALIEVIVEERQAAGYHRVTFTGEKLAPGIYPAKLEIRSASGYFSQYKMMTKTR